MFNRQTVKIGYKCMPNMATTVARHNSKVIRGDNPSAVQAKKCDCEGGTPFCPVEGECRQKGVVYKASVTERMSGKTETYTGLTGREFKERWKEHQKDFENTKNRTKTMLSSHIWELKDRGLDFLVKWEILDRATTYNPVSKKCPLCLKETYFIMYTKGNSSLNKRGEVYNTCRHRLQSLLSKVK